MVKVLFVCLGNICRSPTADGVFRKLVTDQQLHDLVQVDSAGTGNWHVGKAPDRRSQAAAARRGYDLSGLRARQVNSSDFDEFDYILPMDDANFCDLQRMAPLHHQSKIRLFLEHAPQLGLKAVPDPYYEGEEGFEYVLDLVEAASTGLLSHIRHHHLSTS